MEYAFHFFCEHVCRFNSRFFHRAWAHVRARFASLAGKNLYLVYERRSDPCHTIYPLFRFSLYRNPIYGFGHALIGFSINSAAYIAEIIRSALSSVDRGQWDAAKSVGFSYWQTMRHVIVPQSVRIALPPLANVMLDLVKASSLAAMITVPELFQQAKIVGGREFDYMTMYILVALIYWAICSGIALLQDFLEKRTEVYIKK